MKVLVQLSLCSYKLRELFIRSRTKELKEKMLSTLIQILEMIYLVHIFLHDINIWKTDSNVRFNGINEIFEVISAVFLLCKENINISPVMKMSFNTDLIMF